MIRILLIIGIGSFSGGISRFLMSKYIQDNLVGIIPYSTLTVNIIGSFLIGFIFGISEKGNGFHSDWKLFLTVGFCGGFTTFSAFASENLELLKSGNFSHFIIYAGSSVFLGLLAVYLGHFITKLF